MKIIKFGSSGPDVEKWQIFLRGRKKNSTVIVDGQFGQTTHDETKEFQSKSKLTDDGVVGPATVAAALNLGFNLMTDDQVNEDGPNWPQKPSHGSLSPVDRIRLFGEFTYIAAPTATNPEAIKITNGWAKDNISTITICQLSGLKGAPSDSSIQVHKLLENQILSLFSAWESSCLSHRLKSWGGSWVPRFIRGSRTSLSNHSWGTAFDINVQWNMLGTVPALKNNDGSVRELVKIAYDHGFYWGGWFPNRPDGMHFEAFKIL